MGQLNLPNRLIKKIKKDIKKSEIRKNRSQLALSMLLRFRKKRKKTEIMTSIKSHVITIIRRATMQIPISRQKTSVNYNKKSHYANTYIKTKN